MKVIDMFKKQDVGAIGIGAMIVFIAMVLVAGIAASVLIQTSTRLESQAMATGHDTIAEVSTGLAVFDIVGYANISAKSVANTSSNISKMTITVRPRAGSQEIDLNTVFIELSDTNYKIVFNYVAATASNWWDQENMGVDDIFACAAFPVSAKEFGIIVIEDADDSCSETNPVINRGDKVMLCLYTHDAFNASGYQQGIVERTDVWGSVVPEDGSPGVLGFRTPAAYNDYVMDLA
jgi:flagellin FlaB